MSFDEPVHDDEIFLFRNAKESVDESYEVVDMLQMAENINMPYKRTASITEKWAKEGIYEWGVSWKYGWFTNKGMKAEIDEYGFDTDNE